MNAMCKNGDMSGERRHIMKGVYRYVTKRSTWSQLGAIDGNVQK